MARGEQAAGKVPPMPSWDNDARLPGAAFESIMLGSNFLPFGFATRAPVVAERVLPMAERALPTSRAAVSSGAYNPPPIRQRPFARDYRPGDFPHGVPHDAGRLTHDMGRRPLVGRVVGRNEVGGPDVLLPLSEYEPVTVALTGQPTQYRSAAQMPGHFGSTTIDRHGKPIMIEIRDDLLPGHTEMVRAHEIAHAIDDGVGTIPTAGLEPELVPLYNHLNNPKRTPSGLYADPSAGLFTPAERGYTPAEAPREYMIEAIRAYLTNPNWVKVVAPKTAARIREYVNSHPDVSKIIQFNALIGAPAMGAIYGQRDAD